MTYPLKRDIVIATFGGVVVAWVWISVWGLSIQYIWFPTFREHWSSLGGGNPEATRIYSSAFDVVVSIVVAIVLCTPIAYALRSHYRLHWSVFILSVFGSMLVPMLFDDTPFVAAIFLIGQPMFWAFAITSALGFWLASRLREKRSAV